MVWVKTQDLEEGMVLESDVFDRGGRPILKKSVQINLSHIKVLKTWGVPEVEIHIDGSSDHAHLIDPDAEKRNQEIEASEKARFVFLDLENPFLKELFNICVQRKQKEERQKK